MPAPEKRPFGARWAISDANWACGDAVQEWKKLLILHTEGWREAATVGDKMRQKIAGTPKWKFSGK